VIGMQVLVGEVMATGVVRVGPQTPVDEVMRLLRERGVTAVPVVDEGEHVLGVVSAMDLVPDQEQPGGRPGALRKHLAPHARGPDTATAADRMSSPVVSVTPDVSLRTAARLLQVHGIHHLPVIADGKLVGMVTRRDLLAAFLRADEQISRQISHALQITYHLDGNQITVLVHNGVVRLQGRVERRSLVDELERLAAAVDGVVAVESDLGWYLDDTRRGAAVLEREGSR
jgi:CBS domain-containing protein